MNDFLRSKQGILVILTAGLAIFGLMIWLLFGGGSSQTTPSEAPIIIPNLNLETVSEGSATFENVEIKGELPSVPPEMEVFLRVEQVKGVQAVNEMGQNFGFGGEATFNSEAKIYEWSEDGKRLVYNPETSGVIFNQEAKDLDNFESDPSKEVETAGQEYIRNKGLGDNQISGVDWLQVGGGEADLVKNFISANVGVVNLVKAVNGYKVYSQNGEALTQTVWVGSNKTVVKASLMLEQLTSSQKTVEIIPVSQVISLLSQGSGKIVSINGQALSNHNNFVTLEVSSLEIGYFWDQSITILQPIYIVKGKGFGVKDNQGADLVIYLQATKR